MSSPVAWWCTETPTGNEEDAYEITGKPSHSFFQEPEAPLSARFDWRCNMLLDAREESPPKKDWLINMQTGKAIDPDDKDALIDALTVAKTMAAKIAINRAAIEDAIFQHAKHLKKKTRRVQGERRKAKIVMPDDSENQAALKAIVAAKEFKLIWPQLIRVSGYAVKKKEYKKALETEGTDTWNAYRDRVKAAIGPPSGRPRITIEE